MAGKSLSERISMEKQKARVSYLTAMNICANCRGSLKVDKLNSCGTHYIWYYCEECGYSYERRFEIT